MTGALSRIVGDTLKLSEIDCFAIGVSKNRCCNPLLPKKWNLSRFFLPPVYKELNDASSNKVHNEKAKIPRQSVDIT